LATPSAQFEHVCEQAVGRLRAALIELFESVGADPNVPQAVAREYGLNKTLTWNISKVIQAPDHFSAVPHLPGAQSLERLVERMARKGASSTAVQNARDAIQAFDKMVEVHVGDRPTLDLIVDSMAPSSESLELSRKLAFRGNSGLYGVQASTRVLSCMLRPSEQDPSRMDVVMLSGYAGFRRLRPDVRWPLFTFRTRSVEAAAHASNLWGPEPSEPSDHLRPPLVFSRGESPAIDMFKAPDGGVEYTLASGSVGAATAFDCYRGEVFRAVAPSRQTFPGETGEFCASISAPVEQLVLDVIVHEDLAFVLDAEALTYGTMYGSGEATRPGGDRTRLPIRARPVELAGRPPAVSTAMVPRYNEIFRTMHTRLGVDPTRLRGLRLEMKYPPQGGMVKLRFPLPA